MQRVADLGVIAGIQDLVDGITEEQIGKRGAEMPEIIATDTLLGVCRSEMLKRLWIVNERLEVQTKIAKLQIDLAVSEEHRQELQNNWGRLTLLESAVDALFRWEAESEFGKFRKLEGHLAFRRDWQIVVMRCDCSADDDEGVPDIVKVLLGGILRRRKKEKQESEEPVVQ